jgi:histidine ammonia-lyase
MINAARDLARRVDAAGFASKVQGAVGSGQAEHAAFLAEVDGLRDELARAAEFQPGRAVRAAHAVIRASIPFLDRDRALDGEVATAIRLVAGGDMLAAARAALKG